MFPRPLFLAVAALFLGACTSYPLGMTESEWQALPLEAKSEARARQAELDADERRRQAEREERQQARQQALERERRDRISDLYRSARYGDVLQCVMPAPVVDFRPGWRQAEAVAFTLVRGEAKSVPLVDRDRGRRTNVQAHYSADGMTVRLCREPAGRQGQCDSMVGTFADYRGGRSQAIEMSELLKGRLTCAFAPGPGMPETIIIERN